MILNTYMYTHTHINSPTSYTPPHTHTQVLVLHWTCLAMLSFLFFVTSLSLKSQSFKSFTCLYSCSRSYPKVDLQRLKGQSWCGNKIFVWDFLVLNIGKVLYFGSYSPSTCACKAFVHFKWFCKCFPSSFSSLVDLSHCH